MQASAADFDEFSRQLLERVSRIEAMEADRCNVLAKEFGRQCIAVCEEHARKLSELNRQEFERWTLSLQRTLAEIENQMREKLGGFADD